MKKIFLIISILVICVLLISLYFYPKNFDEIIYFELQDVESISVQYELLDVNDITDQPIIIKDNKEIQTIIESLIKYKYSKKLEFFEVKPKSTTYSKVHLNFSYDNSKKRSLITIDDIGEITISSVGKNINRYNIIEDKVELFPSIIEKAKDSMIDKQSER